MVNYRMAARRPTPRSKPKKKSTPKKPAPSAKRKPAPKVAPKPTRKLTAKPTPSPAPTQSTEYDAYREQQAAISRQRSQKGRDIGPIRDIANIERRESCRKSLRKFMETYNPEAFYLGWSKNQLREIARMEECIWAGALYAMADPRGDGKTTRCRMAVLYAIAYGFRHYPVLIGANDSKACDNLRSVKMYIRFLPKFAADFPEISQAAQALGGIANRASGQVCQGEATLIEWSSDRIVLPTVPPPANWPKQWALRSDGMVPTSGTIVSAVGLTADGIRGTLTTTSTGAEIRPDLVLLDDPQTRESARSPIQNVTRMQLVSADVLGMAGPGKSISAFMPCTVIYPGDFIDQILDRKQYPQWRGERTRLLESMPSNMEAWERYFDVFRECAQRDPPEYTEANEHYLEHREELDAGAIASWPERKEPWEISAIQHAMHLYCTRGKSAFCSEYQNQPVIEQDLGDIRQLDEACLAAKLNQQPRGIVPRDCNRLTAFIDVQEEVLFWSVAAWTDRFGGSLLEYGAFPPQPRPLFTAGEPNPKLSAVFPHKELRVRIYNGLTETLKQILTRQWRQAEGGQAVPVSLCLIDSGYETDTVHDLIARSVYRSLLRASKGKGVRAGDKPMNEYKKNQGDLMGWNWRVDAQTTAKGKFISFDVNSWKSFVAEGLLAPAGSAASLYLPGAAIAEHPLLTIHLLSEYRTPTFGRGRRVEEWRLRPGHRENQQNHWLDCWVGCAVGAAVSGLQFISTDAPPPPPGPPPKKWSEIYADK